ncbi:hypothetical protein GOODEAATRI_007802 [Goodea atripinnis]|uniref:Uncharacterized protein n=1 Tax=Goodea atripinnis TaxID=208336 RepID=A0ABV0PC99_9TELE
MEIRNVHIYTIDFTIEYNVGSAQVCLVLFWSSDCQVFIRETAWGKKLSLWRLVLVNSDQFVCRMCGICITEIKNPGAHNTENTLIVKLNSSHFKREKAS